MAKALGCFGGLLLLGLALYVILIFDPFKWGFVYSEHFTWREFGKIKKGDRIESVIEHLGQPVRPAESYSVLTRNPEDPCVKGGCKEYIFAGALWGATFKEAIVITDSKGNVILALARQE